MTDMSVWVRIEQQREPREHTGKGGGLNVFMSDSKKQFNSTETVEPSWMAIAEVMERNAEGPQLLSVLSSTKACT